MGASGKSARRLLQFFKTTDAPAISAWTEALTGQLDNDVEGGQGTLAERPAAKLRGRIWVVQGDGTAANNGVVWWDTGATWIEVNGNIRVAQLAAESVGTSQLVAAAVTDTKVVAGRALLNLENSYTASVEGLSGTPSASHNAIVNMRYYTTGEPGTSELLIGGAQQHVLSVLSTKTGGWPFAGAFASQGLAFYVPKGQMWQLKVVTGDPPKVTSTLVLL